MGVSLSKYAPRQAKLSPIKALNQVPMFLKLPLLQPAEALGRSTSVLMVSNLAPDLAHLGERFWRKSPGGGTGANAGLGLALALALARSLDLRIDFELTEGRLSALVGELAGL